MAIFMTLWQSRLHAYLGKSDCLQAVTTYSVNVAPRHNSKQSLPKTQTGFG